MKKNWLLIALCLGFIVAWQVFVVTPYNKTNAPKAVPAASVLETSTTSTNATPQISEAVPTTQPKKTELSGELLNQAKILKLNADRSVKVFPNGALGWANFSDFKTRGKDSVAVEILKQGFFWSSNNAAVNECLTQLALVQSSDSSAKFSHSVGSGNCELSYLVDSAKEGVVHAELNLQGFAVEKGQRLEFSAEEFIGKSKNPEDNYSFFVKGDAALEKLKQKELEKGGTLSGKIEWASIGDKYFTSTILPKGQFNPNIKYGMTGTDNEAFFAAEYPISLDASGAMKLELDTYFGVKDTDVLTKIHPTLYQAIELGWMGAVARVMLWALKSIYKSLSWAHLGNFGLAIIFLTLMVRALFWPLNKKVFVSGQRMKQLAPQLEKIKAKYGGDRSQMEQMNRETMALYKTNKVNPMGACLPLLLQMPIFIGLYGALSHSLDLYQAPFFGWITDLSSPDPFYVFPALWTVTLLGYTYLNPTPPQAGMPDMKWIMIAMNVFFGFLSKDWPSGLTLYLFISNLVGISQQYMFQRAGKKLQPITEGA